MFEKKEIIFSETMGVCQVAEVTKLSGKSGNQILYYGLKSIYEKGKVAYIPVEEHEVQLRPLISYEKAKELSESKQDDLKEIEKQEIEYVLTYKKEK